MPKAIKIYAISPEKDYRAIEYFFSHLDAFQKHKEQILQCEDLYHIPIAGMEIQRESRARSGKLRFSPRSGND